MSANFDYKFTNMSIAGANYRLPVLNFNSKPFNGQKFNDQVLKRAEMWRNNEPVGQEIKKVKENVANLFTHLISVPLVLNHPDLQKAFIGFRETILSDPLLEVSMRAQINRSNFTFPSMLHLTLL